MKKKIIVSSLVLVTLLVGGWYALTNYIVEMVTNFESFTFERVLGDKELIEIYGIENATSPEDYGYENFELVEFPSYVDQLKLKGWYVHGNDSSQKTIILIHGRTSNRLKTMKYLELFKDTGLDTVYNFFIPDFRNSGESPVAPTYMGYKFSEDIAGSIQYLKAAQGQNKFILYGFSMGAMAISVSLDREDLGFSIYEIERVILDSPLANAKENLRERSVGMGLPNVMFESVYDKFSEEIGGNGENLKFSTSLKDVATPILMIQSNDDESTLIKFTKQEINKLPKDVNIETWFMDGPRHVGIYQSEEWHDEYTERVANFIRH